MSRANLILTPEQAEAIKIAEETCRFPIRWYPKDKEAHAEYDFLTWEQIELLRKHPSTDYIKILQF